VSDFEHEILETALDVHRHLNLEDQTKVLLEAAVRFCGAEAGFAFLPGDSPDVLAESVSTIPRMDPRRRAMTEVDFDAVRQLIGSTSERVLDGTAPFVSPDTAWPGDDAPRFVVVPLRTATDIAGVLLLQGGASGDEGSRASLHKLLERSRPAIANAVHVAAVKKLVILDDTSQCFNRRHFEESLPEELSRAKRFNSYLSLIFFDLDNLKQVNSRHGHSMGSRTLYEVSLRVRARVRKFDKLFRFGGDEFVILLPETEWHGALEVAERVRESIAGNRFLVGKVSDPEGIKMTASFGIASYPLHARTKEDIVQRADRAMQRIKTGTKNSIAIAEIMGDGDGS
jgi:diguanylate cyclase (GGDEF)-like protein